MEDDIENTENIVFNKDKLNDIYSKAYKKLVSIDWKNPRIIFSGIAIVILPFIARHYFFTGLLLGLMLAIAMLFLLEKSPRVIRDLCRAYPLASDITLSSIAVITMGGYFGNGLMLGIAAISCAVAMSYALCALPEPKPKVA